MNTYLNGTIIEMLERAQVLKTKIPVQELPDCFHQLVALARMEINNVIERLNQLIRDPKYQITANLPMKLTDFQRIVREMDYMENFVISALNRYNQEDFNITKFLHQICKEINYPLLPPVATQLSQSYYCIDPKFNHLRVPLLESQFLLHIPDLYHELAHPIIEASYDPGVAPFRQQLVLFLRFVRRHFTQKIQSQNNLGLDDEVSYLEVLKESWIAEGWAFEFFCDLFGIYTVGPAFAWAHLHLSIKRGEDPFETPEFLPTSHPADNARMEMMLIGLDLTGFRAEAINIRYYWQEYIGISGGKGPSSRYKWAYPTEILEHCANLVHVATKAINCSIVSPKTNSPVFKLLNEAWARFVKDPNEYIVWEKSQKI